MPEANQETGAITNEESAVARVASLLEPEGPPDSEETPKATRKKKPEPEAAADEAETEESQEEESEESSEEDEATEPDNEELPDTIEAFAEALGVDPGDLAGHLKVSVKVGGKVQNVTLAEAMKGYQLESDYRQKTSDLAEQRRSLEAQQNEVINRYQQKLASLDEAVEAAEALVGDQPSAEKLAELLDSDPQEYLRQMGKIQQQQAKLTKAREARDKARQDAVNSQRQQMSDYRREQQRLLSEKMPEVRDAAKLKDFESGSSAYLRDVGFSDDEISGFFSGPYDHRQVLLIRDAMRYRNMEKGKATLTKKLSALPKVQKPGAAQRANPEREALQVSKDRLRSLGKKGKSARMQQEKAAVDYVKGLL